MRTRHFFILCGAAVSVMAIQSCKRDGGRGEDFGGKEMTFNAVIEPGSVSKTILDEATGKVNWLPGDNLSVFFNDRQVKFESTATGESESTFFVGTSPVLAGVTEGATAETGFIKALYPYDGNAVMTGGQIVTTLPSVQKAAEGTFGNNTFMSMAQASLQDYTLTFYNVLGGVRFKVDQEGIRRVTLRGNSGEPLAGKIALGFDASGHPKVLSVIEPQTEVTLECPAGFRLDTWYYISTIPAVLSKGYTLAVDVEGVAVDKTSDAACEIRRSVFSSVEISMEELHPEEGFVVFDDKAFEGFCVSNYDTDGDGKISKDEALSVTHMQFCSDELGVKSIGGIAAFQNLILLSVYGTSDTYWPEGSDEARIIVKGTLEKVNVAGLANLSSLELACNKIEEISFGDNSSLSEVHLSYNKLKSVDVSSLSALEYLYVDNNELEDIDVSSNTVLKELGIEKNLFKEADIRLHPSLEKLSCMDNRLTKLQMENNRSLKEVDVSWNRLKDFSIAECPNLEVIDLMGNELVSVDVKNHPSLVKLVLQDNKIDRLDLTGDDNIKEMLLSNNLLEDINLSHLSKLERFQISNNKLNALDLSRNKELTRFWCSNNKIQSLDLKNNVLLIGLFCEGNLIRTLDVSMIDNLTTLVCSPMNDENGRNVLSQLIISKGQSIRNVTYNRSSRNIPDETTIIEVASSSSKASAVSADRYMTEETEHHMRKSTLGEQRRKMLQENL